MSEAAVSSEKIKKQSNFVGILKRLSYRKSAMLGLFLISLLFLLAIFAPLIMPYPYDEIHTMEAFESPSWKHLFGTDNLGRDIFSRMLYGARYSLVIGFGAAMVSHILGMILGSVSGFFGGTVDNVIMRICDIFQSIPGIILNIVIVCSLGDGIDKTIIALGLSATPGVARIMRSSILAIRKMEYMDAAATSNCSNFRIILKHAIPNALSPILVNFTMGVAGAIMGAVSLSYIGLGVQPPLPEWGAMLTAGKQYFRDFPYLCIIPGVVIMIAVLSLNLLGDGLRDAMDPKLKK